MGGAFGRCRSRSCGNRLRNGNGVSPQGHRERQLQLQLRAAMPACCRTDEGTPLESASPTSSPRPISSRSYGGSDSRTRNPPRPRNPLRTTTPLCPLAPCGKGRSQCGAPVVKADRSSNRAISAARASRPHTGSPRPSTTHSPVQTPRSGSPSHDPATYARTATRASRSRLRRSSRP